MLLGCEAVLEIKALKTWYHFIICFQTELAVVGRALHYMTHIWSLLHARHFFILGGLKFEPFL